MWCTTTWRRYPSYYIRNVLILGEIHLSDVHLVSRFLGTWARGGGAWYLKTWIYIYMYVCMCDLCVVVMVQHGRTVIVSGRAGWKINPGLPGTAASRNTRVPEFLCREFSLKNDSPSMRHQRSCYAPKNSKQAGKYCIDTTIFNSGNTIKIPKKRQNWLMIDVYVVRSTYMMAWTWFVWVYSNSVGEGETKSSPVVQTTVHPIEVYSTDSAPPNEAIDYTQ